MSWLRFSLASCLWSYICSVTDCIQDLLFVNFHTISVIYNSNSETKFHQICAVSLSRLLEFTQEENSSFTCFHHLHQIFLPESNKTFFSYWLIFLYCCHTVLDNKVLVQAHFSSFHAQWPIFVFWCLFWMIVPWPIIRFLAQADRFIYIYMLMDESRRFFLKHSQTTCGDEGTVLIFFFFVKVFCPQD